MGRRLRMLGWGGLRDHVDTQNRIYKKFKFVSLFLFHFMLMKLIECQRFGDRSKEFNVASVLPLTLYARVCVCVRLCVYVCVCVCVCV